MSKIFAVGNSLLLVAIALSFQWQLNAEQSQLREVETQLRGVASVADNTVTFVNRMSAELTSVGSLARNANSYAHSHSYSDARLKRNLGEIEQPLAKVLRLQGVLFEWDGQAHPGMGLPDGQQIGFIAQDLEKVLPEAVTMDSQGYRMVNYDVIVPVLVEALKEQQKMIDVLRSQCPACGN
jgi:hypothetical protein